MFKAVISLGDKNITEPNTSPPICLIKLTKGRIKNLEIKHVYHFSTGNLKG